MKEVKQLFTIQSYIDKNRDKIDESLVSLRIMKVIDNYLDCTGINNKDLSKKLGYSESYISQLMSGVKNVNMGFINKFEKKYSIKFEFNINLKKELEPRKHINQIVFSNCKSSNIFINTEFNLFSSVQNNTSMLDVIDIDFETVQ